METEGEDDDDDENVDLHHKVNEFEIDTTDADDEKEMKSDESLVQQEVQNRQVYADQFEEEE